MKLFLNFLLVGALAGSLFMSCGTDDPSSVDCGVTIGNVSATINQKDTVMYVINASAPNSKLLKLEVKSYTDYTYPSSQFSGTGTLLSMNQDNYLTSNSDCIEYFGSNGGLFAMTFKDLILEAGLSFYYIVPDLGLNVGETKDISLEFVTYNVDSDFIIRRSTFTYTQK